MSARYDPDRHFRGSGGVMNYGEMSYLSGDAAATDTVPGMRSGVDSGVNDGSPQAPTWNRTCNKMGKTTGQSYGTPPIGV